MERNGPKVTKVLGGGQKSCFRLKISLNHSIIHVTTHSFEHSKHVTTSKPTLKPLIYSTHALKHLSPYQVVEKSHLKGCTSFPNAMETPSCTITCTAAGPQQTWHIKSFNCQLYLSRFDELAEKSIFLHHSSDDSEHVSDFAWMAKFNVEHVPNVTACLHFS